MGIHRRHAKTRGIVRRAAALLFVLLSCANPETPPAARPSILLVTLGTTHADSIGPDARGVRTPAFNALQIEDVFIYVPSASSADRPPPVRCAEVSGNWSRFWPEETDRDSVVPANLCGFRAEYQQHDDGQGRHQHEKD